MKTDKLLEYVAIAEGLTVEKLKRRILRDTAKAGVQRKTQRQTIADWLEMYMVTAVLFG